MIKFHTVAVKLILILEKVKFGKDTMLITL